MLHVPYKSTPQGVVDLIAGRVSMMFVDLTSGIEQVRAGKLRALATTRIKRSALVPDLPTMDEAGVTGFDMDSWAGFVVPAGTPPRGHGAAAARRCGRSSTIPKSKATLGRVGFEAFSSSPEELEDHINVQLGKWKKMVNDAGIQPE